MRPPPANLPDEPPPGTVWTDPIPLPDARVGDWIEAWVRCKSPTRRLGGTTGGLAKPSFVPRRGRITELTGSVVAFHHPKFGRQLTTRPDILKAWGYRPAAATDNP